MTATTWHLVARGMASLRRSATWWGIGIAAFALVNAGFWPSLEGSEALTSFEDMGALLEAFGAQDIATPSGYLDGQLYALMLPLLLSGLAIAGVTAVTSGDEDAGRLELLQALPVSRRQVWLSRWTATALVVVVVGAAVAVLMLVCLPLFSLDGVGASRVLVATGGCALLAVFHASVAYAAGGIGATRGRAAGLAILVLVAGYVGDFILPLSERTAGAQRWSPWWWAIGDQPVSDGVAAGWLALLVVVTVLLVLAGTAAVERRDIRAA